MLPVLFRDNAYIAINKPAGLLVHRTSIDHGEHIAVLQILRDQIGNRVYPVHRLDKPTSGVILFGLSSGAASRLAEAFKARTVKKTYLALLRGYVPSEATIDAPLKKQPDKRKRKPGQDERIDAHTSYVRLAQTELPYPVGRYQTGRYTLVSACPHTGRMHQLRRHFKHIFHPIIGDRKYGDWRHNALFKEQFGSDHLLLHAARIAFKHPISGQQLVIDAPLPDYFSDLLYKIHLGPALKNFEAQSFSA